MLGSIGIPELLVIFVAVVLILWPAIRICAKAGYPPALGLLAIVPGLNLVLLWYLAFAEWPALRRSNDRDATGQTLVRNP